MKRFAPFMLMVACILTMGFLLNTPCIAKSSLTPEKLAEDVINKIGKEKAWKKTRYLRFDYVMEQNGTKKLHSQILWDKTTGNCRVEWTDENNNQVICLMNLFTKIGTAYINGKMVDYDKTDPYVESAQRKFLLTNYHLYLPYLMVLPNTTMTIDSTRDASESDNNNTSHYHLLTLRIEKSDFVPDGNYTFYVDDKSKFIQRCSYVLKSGEKGDFFWKNWNKFGKIWISDTRESVDGKTVIHFENLNAFNYITPQVFETIHIHLP